MPSVVCRIEDMQVPNLDTGHTGVCREDFSTMLEKVRSFEAVESPLGNLGSGRRLVTLGDKLVDVVAGRERVASPRVQWRNYG